MSRYSKRKKEDTHRQKDDSIIESIELTAQLEDSLRKLINSRRHHEQTVKRQGQGQGVMSFRDEVLQLQQDNAELQADNEQICRDMLRLQQESREFKKEVAEHKKCIAHLQGYNGELKKELMYWMRKPGGGGSLHLRQNISQQDEQESEQELMSEIVKLRRENQLRENELRSVEETVSLKKLKVSLPPNQISLRTGKQTSLHLGSQSKLTKGVKSYKNESNKTMEVSKRGDLCTSCTSCNYLQYSGNKKRRIRSVSGILPQALSKSQKMKMKRRETKRSGLCDCHQHYVDTSRFK